jgi:hypothetical protein
VIFPLFSGNKMAADLNDLCFFMNFYLRWAVHRDEPVQRKKSAAQDRTIASYSEQDQSTASFSAQDQFTASYPAQDQSTVSYVAQDEPTASCVAQDQIQVTTQHLSLSLLEADRDPPYDLNNISRMISTYIETVKQCSRSDWIRFFWAVRIRYFIVDPDPSSFSVPFFTIQIISAFFLRDLKDISETIRSI